VQMATFFINGLLTITVHEGKDLHATDIGKMDPFLELSITHEKLKTKTIKKGGRNPKWDQALLFNMKNVDVKQNLHILAWDEDMLRNDKIGRADIPLTSVFEHCYEKKDGAWFQMVFHDDHKKIAGYLRLSIKWEGPHPSTFGVDIKPAAAAAEAAVIPPSYQQPAASYGPAISAPGQQYAPAPAQYAPAPAAAEAPAAADVKASGHKGKLAFQAHTGKFLCAEQDGRLVCNRDSVREWETFHIHPISGSSQVTIKSHHGKYLCSDSNKAVANRDEAKEWESWTIVDVAYNRVALRDYRGKYLCVDGGGNISVDRDHAKEWEQFTVVKS